MEQNNSTSWSIGCKLVQFQINTQYHSTIKTTPYELAFGQKPRVGISGLLLDRSVLVKLRTEKDLNTVSNIEYAGRNNTVVDDDDASDSESSGDEDIDHGGGEMDDSYYDDAFNSYASAELPTLSTTANSLDGLESSFQGFSPPTLGHESDNPGDGHVELATPATKTNATGHGSDNPGAGHEEAEEAATPATKTAAKQLRDLALMLSKKQKTENGCGWKQMLGDNPEANHVTLDIVLGMKIRDDIAVMWCYDPSDIDDVRNFAPGILRRISNDKYEVMDDKDDICFAELSLDNGDDGLPNLWGTYLKIPTTEFVQYCIENNVLDDGYNRATNSADTANLHEVTPRCKMARGVAADNMYKSANKVYNRVKSKSNGNVIVGDVVHIGIAPQDRGKVDPTNLTGVVVNINEFYGVCQVAVKTGLLRPWYVYHKLRVISGKGNNRKLHDLDQTFQHWQQLKVIAPRTASTDQSLVGGQGIFQCNCRGPCSTNICKCFKNNRICTSACHRNNKCCVNHDQHNTEATSG
jgi:hypothetical protein